MVSCRRTVARLSAVGLVGGLLAVAGCGDLLGFQDAVYVHCVLPSDCGDQGLTCVNGVCTPQCRTTYDCVNGAGPPTSICVDTKCVIPPPEASTMVPADAAVATPEAAADAPPGADAPADAPAESMSEAEPGPCDPHCSEYSQCQSCLVVNNVGFSSTTGSSGTGLAEHGYLLATQLEVNLCGFAIAIGFDLVIADSEQDRFALYTDNGGNPDQLVAQTATGTMVEGANSALLGPASFVGCNEDNQYYWLVGTWNQDSVEFATQPNLVNWIRVYQNDDSAGVLANGFPTTFPAGGSEFTEDQPNVFVSVAHP